MSGPRPLLAARSSSGEKDGNGNASPGSHRPPGAGSGRPKRTLIESACSACRRRKSRCDGIRPTCSRCQNLRTDCHYEAEEGESRWSALRRRNQVLEAERDHIRELMHFVQSRPEVEAQELFQRIRTTNYDDLFLLLRQFKEAAGAGAGVPVANMGMSPSIPQGVPHQGGVSTAASAPLTQSVDQRLPPIQTILDSGARSYPPGVPPPLVHSQSLSSEESRGSSAGMDLTTIPNAHQQMQQRQLLDTLEPSLRPQPDDHSHTSIRGTPQLPILSSEESRESTGSTGSTSMEPPKPYTASS